MLTDTRDMIAVHDAFKRALGDAPSQLASVRNGDIERAWYFADYLGEVLRLLHAHQVGEDELLYPLLSQRAPEAQDLFSRMKAQHAAMLSSLDAAEHATERFGSSGSVTDGQALSSVCEWLPETLVEHLDAEEKDVLPIAARCLSAPEWGALPELPLSPYRGTRVWLAFGLVLEAMPDEVREYVLASVPPSVSGTWLGGESNTFAREMALIRAGGV